MRAVLQAAKAAPAPTRAPAASSRAIQRKATIGPVDDPLEHEADHMADEVMRMADPGAGPLYSGSSSETIRRKAVFRPDSGCSDYTMCKIVAPWDLAVGLVDDAIVVMDDVISKGAKSAHHGKVMARFPAATVAQLASAKTTLTSIKAELASDIVAKCITGGEPCVGNVLAGTTCNAKADIEFCVNFYMNDCRNQAAAIIHEIAHHIVCLIRPAIEVTKKQRREVERDGKKGTVEEEVKEKTGDVYRHFPEFKTLTAAQALQNPDSFAVLCLDVSNRSDCFDCAFIMQTDKKKWDAMKKRLKLGHTAPVADDVKRKCAACEEEEALHRSASGAGPAGGVADAATERAIDGLSVGVPLSATERVFFEPRFGHDFDHVRIHDDASARRATTAVGARAFTLGASIAFAAGEYRPGTTQGRTLLAHELAHVVQQRGSRMPLSRKCAECEAEEEKFRRKCTACEAKEHIQRKPAEAAANAVADGGSPLSSAARAYFEPRFRRDFSHVRLLDAAATRAAQAIDARAYTLGKDIAVASRELAPGTQGGAHPLPHELAHVGQRVGDASIRRKIRSDTQAPLDTYLAGKGIAGFTVKANVYGAAKGGAANFEQELLFDMLGSPRVFDVDGGDQRAAAKSLDAHLAARTGIVTFAAQKKYTFASVTNFKMNPKYYDVNPAKLKWSMKEGVDRQAAWDDLNANPTLYAIGCAAATVLTQGGGSKGAKFEDKPSVDEADWVAGDAGYITNTKFRQGADIGLLGENIIYTGSGQFWGHFSDNVTYKSLADWKSAVASWHGRGAADASKVEPKREIPMTGLL